MLYQHFYNTFSFLSRGTFSFLLAPVCTFRANCRHHCHGTSSLSCYLFKILSNTTYCCEMPCKHFNVCFLHFKNSEGVVPVRPGHLVPEIRVGKTCVPTVPEVPAARQVLLRGRPLFFFQKNSPLKGRGIKCRRRSSSTSRTPRSREARRKDLRSHRS